MKRAPRLTKEQRRDAGITKTQRDPQGHENHKRDQRSIDYARSYAAEVVKAFPGSKLFSLILQNTRAGRAAAIEFERVCGMLTTTAMRDGRFTYGQLQRGEARVKTLLQTEHRLKKKFGDGEPLPFKIEQGRDTDEVQTTLVWLELTGGEPVEPIIAFAVDELERVGWARWGGELAYDSEIDLGDPTGQRTRTRRARDDEMTAVLGPALGENGERFTKQTLNDAYGKVGEPQS